MCQPRGRATTTLPVYAFQVAQSFEVRPHGVNANREQIAHLLGAETGGDRLQHFPFAWRQRYAVEDLDTEPV